MKTKYKLAFMEMAEAFAKTSEAVRLKVGALIVKGDTVIAQGVNGMPPKWNTEVCERRFNMINEREDLVEKMQNGNMDADELLYVTTKMYPYSDECGLYRLETKSECRHAEVAALEKLWNSHNTSNEAIMFVTHAPCAGCAIKIATAGIREVYYKESYRSTDGLFYLVDRDILVFKQDGQDFLKIHKHNIATRG